MNPPPVGKPCPRGEGLGRGGKLNKVNKNAYRRFSDSRNTLAIVVLFRRHVPKPASNELDKSYRYTTEV